MKTGLRVRVLEGQTVDGRTEYEFPASQSGTDEQIVIGRDPEQCQIVFVDELRHKGLGNEHLALRRSLGRYQLDLNTRNPVLLDGRKTFEEKELTGTSVLQLGQGVKLEITVVDDRTATAFEDHSIQQPEEVALGNRKLLAGVAVGVAMLALGGLWLTWRQQQADRKLKDISVSTVSSSTLERTARSVYLIVRKAGDGVEDPVGTGWSGPGGVIVTNAHVAEGIPSSAKGVSWVARSATPPHTEHAITGARIHPGYEAFGRFLLANKPIQEHVAARDEGFGLTGACDVAVLTVDNPAALAPALPIPSREKLKELHAGDAVATVGFPAEGLDATPILLAAPVPVRHRGFLVRLTDFFMRQREDGENQLVQHGLPTAGGSSGSPIIDTEGNVVAVANGGNMQIVPSGGDGATNRIATNVVNFAQRADLVLDLLENRADSRVDEYVAMWRNSLADFRNASEVVMEDFFRETAALTGRPDARSEVREELVGEGIMAQVPEDLAQAVPLEVRLPKGVFTLLVLPDVATDIDVELTDTWGQRVAMDNSLHWHGLLRLANRHPHTYRLIGWTQGEGHRFRYACAVLDWQCDPDEFNASEAASAIGPQLLQTNEAPAFDERTSSSLLDGEPQSTVRCACFLTIPSPGVYFALGEASAPVPIAMTVGAGAQVVNGNTRPESSDGQPPVRRLDPFLVFRVVDPDATVRFDCDAPPPDAADGDAEVAVRVIGWPGFDLPGGR